MTADTALRMEALTGIEASFWLSIQMKYDLWHELQKTRRPKIKRLDMAGAGR